MVHAPGRATDRAAALAGSTRLKPIEDTHGPVHAQVRRNRRFRRARELAQAGRRHRGARRSPGRGGDREVLASDRGALQCRAARNSRGRRRRGRGGRGAGDPRADLSGPAANSSVCFSPTTSSRIEIWTRSVSAPCPTSCASKP
ncbi:hypothetical protein VARIO8X_50329 [Burkholderiales bacterium 8X]|nr:hypothetical protein VARIO8X_50329 [Burkholderiales bacterium 8X]